MPSSNFPAPERSLSVLLQVDGLDALGVNALEFRLTGPEERFRGAWEPAGGPSPGLPDVEAAGFESILEKLTSQARDHYFQTFGFTMTVSSWRVVR